MTEITKKKMDLHGGKVLASNSKGEILGIRGQDYFVIKPGDETLKLMPIPTKPAPRKILFLRADPNGGLWGGPQFGQTLFWMNPISRDLINYPTFCDADGEIFDIAFHDGKIYAVAYAGGDIIQYDPRQPWDQLNRKNPRTIASVGPSFANCHPRKNYIRPEGGIVLGPDHKLYSGWKNSDASSRGAIAVTDPTTGNTKIIESPLDGQTISGLAVDENYIYFTSPESGRIGIFNNKTSKCISRKIGNCDSVASIALDMKTKKILISTRLKSSIFGVKIFDTITRTILDSPVLKQGYIFSRTIAAPGNGKIYYGNGEKQVISIDMKSLNIECLGELPENAYAIAACKSRTSRRTYDVFASCGADVYRIKG